MGIFFNNIGFGRARGERWEEGKGGNLASLSLSLPGIPRALPFFPLPRPTVKKPLRSKQDERGLCGGERRSLVILYLCLRKTGKGNHVIIVTPSFTYSSVLTTSFPGPLLWVHNMFFVLRKTHTGVSKFLRFELSIFENHCIFYDGLSVEGRPKLVAAHFLIYPV